MKKNTDMSRILTKAHENKWVALSPDRTKVISYSSDLVKLRETVGARKVVYTKVSSYNTKHVF